MSARPLPPDSLWVVDVPRSVLIGSTLADAVALVTMLRRQGQVTPVVEDHGVLPGPDGNHRFAGRAMRPEEQEAWYDQRVAPALLDLGRACQARGIPFLAVVGYDGAQGSCGRTYTAPGGQVPFFDIMDSAARCWEAGGGFNVDRFLCGLMERAFTNGHSSLLLARLGVPATPLAAHLGGAGLRVFSMRTYGLTGAAPSR